MSHSFGPLVSVEVLKTVREAVEQAQEVFRCLAPEHAGKLFVDDKGGVVNDLDRTLAGEATAEGAVAERREDCLLSTRSISFESDLSHALYNQGTARLVPHL
jgi:hypothetical protein